MIAATSPVALAASVVAVAASAVFLATILGYRSDPTTRPLICVALALTVGALLHLAVVDLAPVRTALGIQWAPTDGAGGFWLLVAFDLPAVVSGCWFLFALQYTGREGRTLPIAYAAVAVLLVLLVGPNVALAAIGSVLGVPTSSLNALLGITIVLAESLALIGVFLLVASTLRHRAFPATQTVLLTLAVGAVLTLPFAATTLQHPLTTPLAVIASSALFTATLRRYRVFETLPVASVVGRDRVIEEMTEGVVLVGEDARVRSLNPKAESLLDATSERAVGRPLDAVAPDIPEPSAVAASGPEDVRVASGRVAAVTADPVTDGRGRELGHILVLRDVTDARRREHRLGLLTQLLAGATRDEMTDVAAVADAVLAGDRDPAAGGERIHDRATDVATLIARVRDVERALANLDADRTTTATLSSVGTDLEGTTEADVPASITDASVRVRGDPDLLTATLGVLATSAVTDSDAPSLAVHEREEWVSLTIAPFDADSEASLAGLALDLARLAADHTDWTIRPADGPRSAVVVRLPKSTSTHDTATGGDGA